MSSVIVCREALPSGGGRQFPLLIGVATNWENAKRLVENHYRVIYDVPEADEKFVWEDEYSGAVSVKLKHTDYWLNFMNVSTRNDEWFK